MDNAPKPLAEKVRKWLESWGLAIIGPIMLLVVVGGGIYQNNENQAQREEDQAQRAEARQQRAEAEFLHDCSQRLVVNLEKRSQFTGVIQAIDNRLQELDIRARAINNKIVAAAAGRDSKSTLAELTKANQQNEEIEQEQERILAEKKAATAERDKYPLPKLDDCRDRR